MMDETQSSTTLFKSLSLNSLETATSTTVVEETKEVYMDGADTEEVAAPSSSSSPYIYYNKDLIDQCISDSQQQHGASPRNLYNFNNNNNNNVTTTTTTQSQSQSQSQTSFTPPSYYQGARGGGTTPPLSVSNSSIFTDHDHSELPSNAKPKSNSGGNSASPSLHSSLHNIPTMITTTNTSSSSTSPSISVPPPIPARSHKRFHSASTPSTPTLEPRGLASSLGTSFGNISNKISASPLKSKLFKVITNVKNNSTVESILNLSSSSNSTPTSSSPAASASTTPTPGKVPASSFSEPPSVSTSLSTSPATNTSILAPLVEQKSEQLLVDLNFDDFGSRVVVAPMPSTPPPSHQSSSYELLTPELRQLDLQHLLPMPSSDTYATSPATPLQGTPTQRRTPMLHLSYKSSLLNQVSQQQSRSERSMFSMPLLDISPYPKLGGEDSFAASSTETVSYEYLSSSDGAYSSSSDYSSPSSASHYPSLRSSANRQDISLQRFKPLPPLPYSESMSNSRGSGGLSNSGGSGTQPLYNKLSSIIQFISISLPDVVTRGNDSESTPISDEQYRDLTQYLNESGDRCKISQHIQWHLEQPVVNVEIVKLLGTHYGFTDASRAQSWMLMTGYMPANVDNRHAVLQNKRMQYGMLIKKYYNDYKLYQLDDVDINVGIKLRNNVSDLWNTTANIYQSVVDKVKFNDLVQQVHIDVIRTRPDGFYDLFEIKFIEQMIERILVVWSNENQDVSYFQGLNDLICPFLIVFLSDALQQYNTDRNPTYPSLDPLADLQFNLVKTLGDGVGVKELLDTNRYDILSRVEADIFWCLSHLMNSVKSYAANTGCGLPAEGMMKKLESLVKESNEELYNHFKKHDIDFSHFSFRWMVCFLIREMSFETGIKLWDRYMCDKNSEGFSVLHICFCATLLSNWSAELLNMGFMELVTYLQKSDILPKDQLDSFLRSASDMRDNYRDIL
ncbi:hypothetical protein SAMD00019534_037440 [Acytostelium subglobosum LB1]|uniref:hypothetical protein n=1 Tax=Acytostelium subglobosum LB1 TaxID=1410327 RepID=UPI0006448BB2|nr:hypothetical protein SAMD00019534_037440 [Acytostelium subglobosum LB1]GAM20569.1 hypothetical protein SAMD00019534_037440 [Acytostelium subglobosum LB1]|eukprot:XP_012760090.1 hypothetical protein SAMD00019534_037440 [Acytostelium subglobosum LB1]